MGFGTRATVLRLSPRPRVDFGRPPPHDGVAGCSRRAICPRAVRMTKHAGHAHAGSWLTTRVPGTSLGGCGLDCGEQQSLRNRWAILGFLAASLLFGLDVAGLQCPRETSQPQARALRTVFLLKKALWVISSFLFFSKIFYLIFIAFLKGPHTMYFIVSSDFCIW